MMKSSPIQPTWEFPWKWYTTWQLWCHTSKEIWQNWSKFKLDLCFIQRTLSTIAPHNSSMLNVQTWVQSAVLKLRALTFEGPEFVIVPFKRVIGSITLVLKLSSRIYSNGHHRPTWTVNSRRVLTSSRFEMPCTWETKYIALLYGPWGFQKCLWES